MVPSNPSTDAQNHEILFDYFAVDFAGHFERPSGIVASLASSICNPIATRKLLKTRGREGIRGKRVAGVSGVSGEFRESRESRNFDRNTGIGSAEFKLEFIDFQGFDAGLKSRRWNS